MSVVVPTQCFVFDASAMSRAPSVEKILEQFYGDITTMDRRAQRSVCLSVRPCVHPFCVHECERKVRSHLAL